MLNKLFATSDDLAPFIARVAVGGVLFAHGAQKLLGWFGGKGWAGTMEFFTNWGFHPLLVVLLILIESIGMLLLIAGFGGRIWAALLSVVMVVAVIKARHYQWFFMNWYAERRGEGFEFHILVLALALIVLVLGSGKWSVDLKVFARAAPHPGPLPTHVGRGD